MVLTRNYPRNRFHLRVLLITTIVMILPASCVYPTVPQPFRPLIRRPLGISTRIDTEPSAVVDDDADAVAAPATTLQTKAKGRSLDFMFPSETELRPEPTALVPPKNNGNLCLPEHPVCTNVNNYPQQLINALVAPYAYRFAEVFGNDVVLEDSESLQPRFDTSDDDFLCMSDEKLVHPQSGYTMEEKLVMIVNTPNYMQGVRIEICRKPGKPCSNLEVISMYRTECKQLYHYRTLLAIDAVTKQPYKESFRMPSCCKCVFKPLRIDRAYGRRP